MRIIYTPDHRQHNPLYELYDNVETPYAESADRADAIAASLAEHNYPALEAPRSFDDSHVTALHRPTYVKYLKERSAGVAQDGILYPSYFITDTYAPIVHGTYPAARQAADVALTGADLVLQGESLVYSICRPPGHHAQATSMGGYCYFNNSAIAANYLSHHGRVSILDIDFHHGNGTQHFFYDRADVQYVSIHGAPERMYPYISGYAEETGRGDGLGTTRNYPQPAGITDEQYRAELATALSDVKAHQPDYLLISAGFDTYEHDPICDFKLTTPFFAEIGGLIKDLQLPTLVIQEGGYNVQALGGNVHSFLSGLTGAV